MVDDKNVYTSKVYLIYDISICFDNRIIKRLG